MFIQRPVVAGQDGKKAGPGPVNLPIGRRRQVERVILRMHGKKGAIEKLRRGQRRIDRGNGMVAALLLGNVQPLMKEKAQNFPMVIIGRRQGGPGKSLLEQFRRDDILLFQIRRDDILLFQNPGEHRPYQMPQHGLPLRPPLAGLPVGRPPGDFPIKLLTEGGRFQRQQQLLGGQPAGRRPMQQLQQLVGGGPGRGRGQSGVKGGGHIDLPIRRHRQARFPGSIGGGGVSQQRGGPGWVGGGKGPGRQGRVGAAQAGQFNGGRYDFRRQRVILVVL